jgi:soluble cytochrome b562
MLKTVRPAAAPDVWPDGPACHGRDLEQPMKKIGFNYKQAVKADDAATMEKYIKEMKAQLDVARERTCPLPRRRSSWKA